jgi:predicted phosphodiesterase
MTLQEQNLTEEQYENCLSDIADKVNGVSDLDWSEIIAKYNLNMASDTLRKASQTIFGGAFVKQFIDSKHQVVDTNDNSSYEIQLREIRREKQKLFDERMAFNKSNRDIARLQQDLDYLESLIKDNQYEPFQVISHNDRDKDLVVLLSDMHIGLNIDSNFGKYNSDIAKSMLATYFGEIVNAIELYKIKNVYVIILGDVCNGNIHPTVQLQNRENIIEQIQLASELVSDFIYHIAQNCDNVYVNSVMSSNHCRLGKKDDVMRDERLDTIVTWYAKAKLQNINNIIFAESENIDPTISKNTIRGKVYYAVHGDYDSYSESGINKLIMMTKEFPTGGIFYGHLHHNSYDDINDIKIIRSGSFAGTGDDYTVSKRISGKPSQVMCVVDDTGIKNFIPVDLDIL